MTTEAVPDPQRPPSFTDAQGRHYVGGVEVPASVWAEYLQSGFTAEEFLAWDLTARAAHRLLALPEQHPSEMSEIAQAIHVIQNKLMARPTRRAMGLVR